MGSLLLGLLTQVGMGAVSGASWRLCYQHLRISSIDALGDRILPSDISLHRFGAKLHDTEKMRTKFP